MASSRKSENDLQRGLKNRNGREQAGRAERSVASNVHGLLQRVQEDTAGLTQADVLQLQRSVGNRATRQILQTKLTLGPAGDQYEQEADRVAQQVTRSLASPAPSVESPPEQTEQEPLQRQPAAGQISRLQRSPRPPAQKRPFVRPTAQRQSEEDELAQATANHGLEGGEVDTGVESAISQARGGGKALDDGVRSSMEGAFGADFSSVNVHTGPESDALNRSLNARAFTTGSDIFFAQGQYNPGSSAGQELIAHELTHTVQQGAAGVQTKQEPDPGRAEDAEG